MVKRPCNYDSIGWWLTHDRKEAPSDCQCSLRLDMQVHVGSSGDKVEQPTSNLAHNPLYRDLTNLNFLQAIL